MKIESKRTKKLRKWRQKLYQDLIERGTIVEVCFIDPLPKGSGTVKSVIGRVIEQKSYIFCVLEQHSTDIVRVKKNKMVSILSRKKCVHIPSISTNPHLEGSD